MLEELKMPMSQLKDDIMNVWNRLDPDSIQKKIDEKMRTCVRTLHPFFYAVILRMID